MNCPYLFGEKGDILCVRAKHLVPLVGAIHELPLLRCNTQICGYRVTAPQKRNVLNERPLCGRSFRTLYSTKTGGRGVDGLHANCVNEIRKKWMLQGTTLTFTIPRKGGARMNLLYYGDNLTILRDYIDTETIDLIYLDPPFNSNRSYNVLFNRFSPHENTGASLF